MALGEITRRGVDLAIAQFDDLGREAFLAKHEFDPSRHYFVVHEGRRYDSKAIAAAARSIENPDEEPRRPKDLNGGAKAAARRLENLGVQIEYVDLRRSLADGSGHPIDATFDLEGWGIAWRVSINSRGGSKGSPSARNTDYTEGLRLLLSRLAVVDAVITDAAVDSTATRDRTLEERRLALDYPVHLSAAGDISALGREVQRSQTTVAHAAAASRGGNSTRRICMWVTLPAPMKGADLRDHLVGGQAAEPAQAGTPTADPGSDWSEGEVAVTVDSYFEMLIAELAGEPYSKASHRRALERLLPGRSKTSIEFKHQNISAAMVELGLPYIRGYRPADNYQGLLITEIQHRLAADPTLLEQITPSAPVKVATPPVRRPKPRPTKRRHVPRQVDFDTVRREQSRIGRLGEEQVVDLERARLRGLNKHELAEKVRWVAKVDGDGAGYDVLSFSEGGAELYIEVKATTLGEETPFYLSAGELSFARDHVGRYEIHRLYNLDTKPEFYVLDGDVASQLDLEPITYRSWLIEPPADQAQ